MEAFVVNPARIVSDVIGCIAELKNTFHSSGQPINDDDITLQKFCVKLETVLRYEQKEKYTILGLRKDYWNFITDVIPKDDGVKYVNMVPQMKTVQGKGRCFIRYALVKQTLADTIQRLLVSSSTLNSWYREDAILRNPSLSTALVNKLYDLNDVVFDLPCAGYELDISWPAFSRKTAKDGNTSGRRSSISSMSSVDFRNERRDPVIDLAAEVASLREFFNPEGNLLNQDAKTKFDNVSLASETPTITELTLQISNIHKRALKWKADFTNERVSSAHELRKAQDDRQFAIQESELKTKQLTEKFSNLAKTATEENERKISKLTEALSSAEAALQERDAELRELRDEINKSVMSSSTAHKSAMDIEKQLMVSERKRAEAESQLENLKQKLVTSQQSEGELNDREKRMKERIDQLKTKEAEYKDRISELSGQLKAKEIALDNIQESFENLTGMVFGSFEEVESNMKEKLIDREKGLQSQTLENRKLELQVTDLEHQLRKAKTALANSKSSLSSLESSYTESESSKSVLEKMLKDRDETLSDCMTFLQELQSELGNGSSTENVDKKTTMINDKDTLQNHFHTLSSLVQDIKMKLSQAEELNALNKNELTNKQDEILRLSSIIEELKQQIQQLEIEIQEKCTEINSLNSKLDEASGEVARTSKNLENAEKSLTALREDIRVLTEEKATMEAQVGIDREQLQQANEGRIKAESSQVNTEEELKNLRCVMEQEVAALKFQLSSETMKFEEEIKVLSEQNQESIGYRERCNTLEETVADLETSMKERTNEWEGDKRKYVAEIKRLRNQVQVLNNAMEGNKQRSMTLENDLILTTKQLEEEKHRQKETKQKVQDAENRKLESEKQLQAKMDAMKEDMKDLKSRIVSLTREKAELFEKALNFEHELKLKAADRWVEDKEAKNCSGCKAEFSFLLRRHHCRLCGRIFCYSCVNNWVRTAHSSKLKRVCNSCLSKDQRLKPQKAPQRRNTDTESDYDETMSDISIGASPGKMNTSTSSIDFSDDESAAAAARRTSPSTPKKSTIKEEDKDDDDEPPKEKIDSGKHVTVGKNENVIKELSTKTSQTPTTGSKGVDSPDGEGYEFIDQNEEIGELLESRIVISQSDIKEELTIPAVNDDEGISRELTVPLGTRYIVPVMVATPGAILCWSFKTVYKSIIFGLGYKSSESVPDDDVETLYPLARFESNVAPIEGEWKTSSHGVYVLVFDNCFSRFTSKQLSYSIHVKRRPSLLKSSPTTKEITGQEKR